MVLRSSAATLVSGSISLCGCSLPFPLWFVILVIFITFLFATGSIFHVSLIPIVFFALFFSIICVFPFFHLHALIIYFMLNLVFLYVCEVDCVHLLGWVVFCVCALRVCLSVIIVVVVSMFPTGFHTCSCHCLFFFFFFVWLFLSSFMICVFFFFLCA